MYKHEGFKISYFLNKLLHKHLEVTPTILLSFYSFKVKIYDQYEKNFPKVLGHFLIKMENFQNIQF